MSVPPDPSALRPSGGEDELGGQAEDDTPYTEDTARKRADVIDGDMTEQHDAVLDAAATDTDTDTDAAEAAEVTDATEAILYLFD